MGEVANVPFINQLTQPTYTGKPLDNANYDCVPCSAAAGATAVLLNHHIPISVEGHNFISGDELKDEAYGTAYRGGTAMVEYVNQATDLLRQLNIDAAAYTNADPHGLITKIKASIDVGQPLVVTIPSAWGTVFPLAERQHPDFSSHCILMYGYDGTNMWAMNPWGGFKHIGTFQYWADRLCYEQVWPMFYTGGPQLLQLAQTLNLFTGTDARWTRTDKPALGIQGAILTDYRNFNFPVNTIPFPGLPTTNEVEITVAGKNAWVQVFERSTLICDPSHVVDGAPGFGQTYPLHLDDPNNPFYIALLKEANAADSAEATVAAQLKIVQAQLATTTTQLSQAQNQVTALTGQLAAAAQTIAADKAAAAQATANLAGLNQQLAAAESQVQALGGQIAKLTGEETTLQAQLADAQNRIAALNASVADLQTELTAAQAGEESPAVQAAVTALVNLDTAITAIKQAQAAVTASAQANVTAGK